jgi:hypothetical protein
MRTKALLLAAAFAAVGVATSVAQVYSVNAVGYVNVPLTPGFNLVSNPLDAGAGNNTVANLFKNITPTPLNGIRVYTYDPATGGYLSAQWSPVPNVGFGTGAGATAVVPPGQGAFVFNPDITGTAARTLTFVGEVMQGTLSNPLPVGFSIRANQVPQSGNPSTFGLPGVAGDKVYRFNKTTGGYDTYQYSGAPFNSWRFNGQNVSLPSIEVGEAFFFFNSGTAARSWNRTFNVNNPS